MSTYLIGDVQGCFDSLQELLKKIEFDPAKDRLGFVGDLVNRGPKSLETLRFIAQLKNPIITLGNHDWHLLALYFVRNFQESWQPNTLQTILAAPDCRDLMDFLLQQSLLLVDEKFVVVHAGIPPQWSIDQAMTLAIESKKLWQKDPKTFCQYMYGNHPQRWRDDLTEWDRVRYVMNAFTRMRFCTRSGELDLDNKTVTHKNKYFKPWFDWRSAERDIYFGHWAALRGQCTVTHIHALDTGCAWGESLTAMRVEDRRVFVVGAVEAS